MSHSDTLAPQLKAYLDHELTSLKRLSIRLHLLYCAECRREFRMMCEIGEQIRAHALEPLPQELRAKVLNLVRDEAPRA